MTNLVNLTPHRLVVLDNDATPILNIAPSGTVARVREEVEVVESLTVVDEEARVAVPVRAVRYAEAEDLPPPVAGTTYVVSLLTALGAGDRADLVYPFDEVRDASGRIRGVRGLGRLSTTRLVQHAR